MYVVGICDYAFNVLKQFIVYACAYLCHIFHLPLRNEEIIC